jgi:hypothetical protein
MKECGRAQAVIPKLSCFLKMGWDIEINKWLRICEKKIKNSK